jgi:LysR family hydrogen peroxide-inducible transcriptional activator
VAVDKLRHFGKAAESCNVSQPTLSMQIQKVEEEIGYPLFDRQSKPVAPTAKGQKFIHQAKALLNENQKLLDLSRNQGTEISGELRLGVIPTIAPYLVPLFLQQFSQRFPKVNLMIDELKTNVIIAGLTEGSLDAGILATPIHERGLTEKPIYYEPFSLYVSKNSPLSARKRIKESDLQGSEMWLLADGHCFRNQIVRYCSLSPKDGVFPNVQFAGGNLDTLRNLIRTSRGYTLVPELFVQTLPEIERRDYVRDFEKPVPTREISLMFRRDSWKADMVEALEKVIRESLPESLAQEHDPKGQDVIPIG